MSADRQIIDDNKNGQRIDNFLFTRLKGVPKSHVYRLLRTGRIRVNGKRVKQTYRLQTADEVLIPPLRISSSKLHPPDIAASSKAQVKAAIIFEDEDLLVINKPPGMAVHPGTQVAIGVIEVVRSIRPKAQFLELVHRLDRETSGCLLIAKNKNSLHALHLLLRNRQVRKEYIAAVKGAWGLGEKIIETPLASKRAGIDHTEDGRSATQLKTAMTHFSPSKIYIDFSLMKVRIDTGRTHQIRIHAAQSGHPVVGDQKYGDFVFNRVYRKLGIKRMLLHAVSVSFCFPASGKKFHISAPLDEEFTSFLEQAGVHS